MEKNCISCGMPLKEKQDFPLEDETKDFCVHCSDPEGNLFSYDTVKENLAQFLSQMQNIDIELSRKAAGEYMKSMPAWKDQ